MDLGQTTKYVLQALKQEFAKPPALGPYDLKKKTIISTDASNKGLGAVMTQIQKDNSERLVAAASRSLTSAKEGYSTIEKEALGVSKCTQRAKRAVWWLSLNKPIEEMISHWSVCRNRAPEVKEPLRPLDTLRHPWQVLASDLFYHSGQDYLLVVDWYSRYTEITALQSTTSKETPQKLFCETWNTGVANFRQCWSIYLGRVL